SVKGFLYQQKGENYALRLTSAFDDLAASISQETRFVTQELALFNAQTLLTDPDFRQGVTKLYSEDYLTNIRVGIKASAGYQLDQDHVMDTFLMKVRNNFVRAAIGLNPFVALKAPISWLYGLQYVKPEFMAKGTMAGVLKEGQKNMEFLMEMSGGFKERVLNGNIAEASDLLANKSAVRLIKSGGNLVKGTVTYDDVLFSMIKFADKTTVTSVMAGAILQAREEFASGKLSTFVKNATGYDDSLVTRMTMEEKEAASVAFGEYVMDRSQPSFNPLNRNAFQRGSAIARFFSIYGSFTTVTHNMMMDGMYQYKKFGNSALPHIGLTLGLWALTSVANVGVNQLRNYATGREPDPAWDWVLGAMLGNAFVLRELYSTAASKVKYGFAGGSSVIPLDEILNGSVDAAYLLVTGSGLNGGEFNLEKFMKGWTSLGRVVSKSAGIPTTPITLPMDIITESMTENPREEWKFDN
ncbi:MAG: hypothetical protein JRC86_11340, partial [Deltaproteobacteria bacterium]|nr:hypothetical protein [Deltaproteobacteria bacterium]